MSDALAPIEGPCEEGPIRKIVGAMVKAMPAAATAVTAEFMDAIIWAGEHDDEDKRAQLHGLRGFRPPVLLMAAFHVVAGRVPRTDAKGKLVLGGGTFLPSVAEFLATARIARFDFVTARDFCSDRLLQVILDAEWIVEWIQQGQDDDDDP